MKHSIGALALACMCAVALHAQDAQVKSKTTIKADDAKVVNFTGCLASGAEQPKAFILERAVPVSRTTTQETATGTSGTPETTTTTTTTYALIPGESVEFEALVGHKVEVTGVLVKAATANDDDAKVKTTTETKTKVEGAPDKKTKEETKLEMPRGAHPQLKVVSIKHLADTCTM